MHMTLTSGPHAMTLGINISSHGVGLVDPSIDPAREKLVSPSFSSVSFAYQLCWGATTFQKIFCHLHLANSLPNF